MQDEVETQWTDARMALLPDTEAPAGLGIRAGCHLVPESVSIRAAFSAPEASVPTPMHDPPLGQLIPAGSIRMDPFGKGRSASAHPPPYVNSVNPNSVPPIASQSVLAHDTPRRSSPLLAGAPGGLV